MAARYASDNISLSEIRIPYREKRVVQSTITPFRFKEYCFVSRKISYKTMINNNFNLIICLI